MLKRLAEKGDCARAKGEAVKMNRPGDHLDRGRSNGKNNASLVFSPSPMKPHLQALGS